MITETEKRLRRCCFTGHRSEKLTRSEMEICIDLEKEIRLAIADGFTTFISGMARGVDIWAAEIILRIRNDDPSIKLICASPYEGFEHGWKESWNERYSAIIRSADLVRYISPRYSRTCFQIRNEWMVEHSSRVIAVYNGSSGGTKNTIDFAKRIGVSVNIIDG